MATILVIEDEVDVTEVIKRRLKDAGHIPLIANDPYNGLKLAREEKPDLILLDLKLPTGGGLSVLKNLKTSTETQGIPVIILTGSRSTEVKEKALKDGAVAYLEKPYDHHVLLATIKDVLEKRVKGFTLIEMVTVVAIIAIIFSGLATINYFKARETAGINLCLENRHTVESAEQRYFADKEKHSTSLADLVDEGYLSSDPECPMKGVYAWSPPAADQSTLGCSIHTAVTTPASDKTKGKSEDAHAAADAKKAEKKK